MSSPLLLSTQRYETGADESASTGLAVDPDNTAHTKGAYLEFIASTSFRASGLIVARTHANVQGGNVMYDIAIGAGGSEQIIVANLFFQHVTGNHGDAIKIPIAIPAGSRLSMRAQTSGANETGEVCTLTIYGGGALDSGSGQRCETYGANTTDTGGVSVDPGAVAHTKGVYSELVAATAFDIKKLILCIGEQLNAALTEANFLFDVAIGAAGSEQVIVPNLPLRAAATPDAFSPLHYELDVDIPAGTRIAIRAQSSTTDATDRLFDVVGYGVG